MDECCNVTVSC